jgi:hypothetical protein
MDWNNKLYIYGSGSDTIEQVWDFEDRNWNYNSKKEVMGNTFIGLNWGKKKGLMEKRNPTSWGRRRFLFVEKFDTWIFVWVERRSLNLTQHNKVHKFGFVIWFTDILFCLFLICPFVDHGFSRLING